MPARLDRWSVLILTAVSLYLAVVLGTAVARAEIIEQDAAYYCVVTERFVAGEGLTSLCDRRGPVLPTELPAPMRAGTWWPVLLAPLVSVTGEARYTATVVSLLGLIAALWLGALAIRRATEAPPWIAALCVTAALLHSKACSAAVLPLTDTASLGANAAVLLAVVSRRPWIAVLTAGLAVALRFQNAALVLPLLWLIPREGMRRRTVLVAIAACAAATCYRAGWQLGEGVLVVLDPTHRDSLFRALRFLFAPMIVGLWCARRCPAVAPSGCWRWATCWCCSPTTTPPTSAGGCCQPTRATDPPRRSRPGRPRHRAMSRLVAGRGVRVGLRRRRGKRAASAQDADQDANAHRSTRDGSGARPPAARSAAAERHRALARMRRAGARARDPGIHLRGHEPGEHLTPYYLDGREITHVLLAWGASRHVVSATAGWTPSKPSCAAAARSSLTCAPTMGRCAPCSSESDNSDPVRRGPWL